jgi:hypothetical protein
MLANTRSFLASSAVVAASAALVVAAVGGGAVWHFGSVPRVLAYLRGGSVIAEPSAIDVGEVALRAEVTRAVSITTLTSRPIHVLGGNTTCDFGLAESLPMDLGPGACYDIIAPNTQRCSGHTAGPCDSGCWCQTSGSSYSCK